MIWFCCKLIEFPNVVLKILDALELHCDTKELTTEACPALNVSTSFERVISCVFRVLLVDKIKLDRDRFRRPLDVLREEKIVVWRYVDKVEANMGKYVYCVLTNVERFE